MLGTIANRPYAVSLVGNLVLLAKSKITEPPHEKKIINANLYRLHTYCYVTVTPATAFFLKMPQFRSESRSEAPLFLNQRTTILAFSRLEPFAFPSTKIERRRLRACTIDGEQDLTSLHSGHQKKIHQARCLLCCSLVLRRLHSALLSFALICSAFLAWLRQQHGELLLFIPSLLQKERHVRSHVITRNQASRSQLPRECDVACDHWWVCTVGFSWNWLVPRKSIYINAGAKMASQESRRSYTVGS